MRKTLIFCLMVFFMIMSVPSFCRAADSPEAVFKKYIKAVKDGKFDEVSKCLPKAMQTFYAKQPDSVKKTYMAVQRGTIPEEFSVKDIKIDGKQAILKYEGTGREGKEGASHKYKASVTFINEDGNWKYMQETREEVKK